MKTISYLILFVLNIQKLVCVLYSQLNFKCLIAVEGWELPYWTGHRVTAMAALAPLVGQRNKVEMEVRREGGLQGG